MLYLNDVVGGGRRVKGSFKNSEEILKMIRESFSEPVIFVITRLKQPFQSRHQAGYEVPQSQLSFRASNPNRSLPDDLSKSMSQPPQMMMMMMRMRSTNSLIHWLVTSLH